MKCQISMILAIFALSPSAGFPQDFKTKSFKSNDSVSVSFICAWVGSKFDFDTDAKFKQILMMQLMGASDDEINDWIEDVNLWLGINKDIDFSSLWPERCKEGAINIDKILSKDHPEYFIETNPIAKE